MRARLCSRTVVEYANIRPIAVNPQAVNEPGFDVFTANKRAVLYMTHTHTHTPVAFVAIGAMLVRPLLSLT